MELTALPLAPEIWAATPCAAQALIVAQRERIRDLEARRRGQPWRHPVVELLPLAMRVTEYQWRGRP